MFLIFARTKFTKNLSICWDVATYIQACTHTDIQGAWWSHKRTFFP